MKPSGRRLLIRAIGWLIAASASVVAVLLLLFAAFLLFFDTSEQLRARLEAELTRLSGAPAKVGSIRLDIPRFAFELRRVEVGSPGVTDPILEIDRIWGRLRLSEVLSLRLHWDELEFDGVSLRLVQEENGGVGLPNDTRTVPLAAAGVSFAADRLSLRNAFVVISNERVPWDLEADAVELSLERAFRDRYEGRLRYERGRLRVEDQPVAESSLEARFDIEARELYLREARLATDYGELQGTGKLSFAGAVRGRFDLTAEAELGPAAAAAFGEPERSPGAEGALGFRGVLTVEPQTTQLEGTLILPEGRVRGVPVSSWRGELFWDRALLQISYAEGRVAGGRGRLQLHQPLPISENPASLEIDVTAAALAELVELRSDSSPVSSELSGRASVTFPSSAPDRFEGTFELHGDGGAAPVHAAAPIPLTFDVRGRFADGDLDIEQAELATESLAMALSGIYPRQGAAALAVEVESTDLAATDRLQREVRALLRGDPEDRPQILGLSGSGRARGTLTGRLPHLTYEGELSVSELEFLGVRLTDVRARGSLSRETLGFEDLVARSGEGAIAGRGQLSLRGSLDSRPFDLELTLSGWPASDVSRALGLSLPLAGALSGDVTAQRSEAGLSGTASLTLDSGAIGSVPVERASGRGVVANGVLQVAPLTLEGRGAHVEGTLTLDLDRGDLSGSLAARRVALDALLPGADVGGRIEGRVSLGGRLDAPQATLSGRGQDVRLAGVELGELFLSGELRDGAMDAHASFEREAAELVAEATWRLEPELPVSGRLVWRQLDVRPWIFGGGAGGLQIVSEGEASFRAALAGADLLSSLDLEASLAGVSVEDERFRFVSSGPVQMTLSEGRLEIAALELARGPSRVALDGGLDLRERTVDLDANGAVSLDLLEIPYPSLETTGALDLSARVTGAWSTPSLSGHADFRGGSLRLEGFPQALGGLRGRLLFDNRTVRVNGLRGVFGSGPVAIDGTILLEGLEPGSVDLALRGDGIRLRYPEGLVATLDAELALLGQPDERVLSGTVTFDDAVWSREYDLVSGILSDRDAERLFGELEGQELVEGLRLDIAIAAPQSLKLRNSLAEIDASAELELRGSVRDPVLLGRSEAERGDVYFLGQRYDIIAGKVDFVNPTRVEPFIDLTAETRVRNYRVELRLIGTPDRFQPELSSDPPLRTVDILRLLAGGSERDIGLLGNEEEELAGVGVASLLTERLNQEVGRRAERLFGLDRFAIDPFLIGQFANPTARVSLGKQITRDLIINYSTNLNATTEAIILIEYTPDGPISWILSRSEEGDVGVDLKFRKSF